MNAGSGVRRCQYLEDDDPSEWGEEWEGDDG